MTPTPHRHAHALPEDPDAPASQEADQERRSTRTMALRAGLAALALSVAVAGGAYAAVRVGQNGSSSDTANQHADILGAEGGRSGVSVTPSAQKVTTETVDATDPHGTVQQESSDLPQGETKIATSGVDGVVRTTYEITTVGGKEVSRTPIAQVVVTQKVDEVVLVGTGAAKKQEQPQSQEQTPAPSAPSEVRHPAAAPARPAVTSVTTCGPSSLSASPVVTLRPIPAMASTACTSSPWRPGRPWAEPVTRTRPMPRPRPPWPRSFRLSPAGASGPVAPTSSACAEAPERPARPERRDRPCRKHTACSQVAHSDNHPTPVTVSP